MTVLLKLKFRCFGGVKVVNNQLIGKWSIDIMYGPGAQEDTLIIFREDGTGYIEYMSAVFREIEIFEWKSLEDDSITILGKEKFDSENEYEKSNMKLEKLKYEIKEEETPSGITMEVLTFLKPIWLTERKFGIESRLSNKLSIPKVEEL